MSFTTNKLFGQVEFKIEMLSDSLTYMVVMKPNATWNPPFNITSSAQVTIKAPTGGFDIANVTSLVATTNWSHNATYVAPNEEPTHDYFSIGLTSLGTSAFTYQAGNEVPVFTFENSGTCTGLVELMEAGDPFTPPNSQNGNVGNQITILGAGSGNAWTGNYGQGQADCGGAPPPPPTCQIDNVTSTNLSDCGSNDGSITINATASATLEYSIDNGQTWHSSNQFSGLIADDYNIQIQTVGGACSVVNPNNPVTITEPTIPSIDLVTSTDPTNCNASDGSISVQASGGTGSFEYQLDNNGWGTSPNFLNLAAGNYTVHVRNDDGTCAISQNASVNAPSAPSIDSVNPSDPTACGVTDGEITINASGGTGSYEYSLNGTDWFSDDTFTNLDDNTYDIFVRNDDGTCETQGSAVTLSGPQDLTISVTTTDPSACGESDGSITISASGGTGSYEYSVDDGNSWSTATNYTDLPDGDYDVWVRNDDVSCGTAFPNNPVSLNEPNCPTGCVVDYELELLPDGRYQVSLISNVNWMGFEAVTSTAQVTILTPTGGFEIANLTNLVPGVTFAHNATFEAPTENTSSDYLVFGLTSIGTSGITYQNGLKVPLFTFTNSGVCTTGDLSLMDNDNDPFFPPNSLNANVGQQLTTGGSGPDADICIVGDPTPCSEPSSNCLVEYVLELLPNGTYQVSVIPDTTWAFPDNITSTAQVTLVASTGGFVVANVVDLISGVDFENNVNYFAPAEDPTKDYFLFGLISSGTSGINYQKGVKTPLFTFENGGSCTSDSLYLMQPDDLFLPPNSQNANVGQQLSTIGSGIDANICVSPDGVECVTPFVDESCTIGYELELLPNGVYQVSVIPDTTWTFPDNLTSTAQVTLVVPTGSLEIINFTNLISGAEFENNATYVTPNEAPNKDYFLFGLTANATSAISYDKGIKTPLFTFENGGECTGDSIYLMPIEGDPFEFPNSQNANVGQQLSTAGSGPDAEICILSEGVVCVPCGPNMPDSDGDGYCDNEEINMGSDPNDPCDPDLFNDACDFVCPEYFSTDYVLWHGADGPATVCIDIPGNDIPLYEILLDQVLYTEPPVYCGFDTLTFYSYAFTVGQGNAGPYFVDSWVVNGTTYSGFIADMYALADSMNVWDPVGNWSNTSGFASVSGGSMGNTYGNMKITHIGTNVPTFIQPNITFVGIGSNISISGVGEHELIVNDPNGCSDTIIIDIYLPEMDVVEEVYPVDSSYLDICLSTDEMPDANYTATICDGPDNGTATVLNGTCIQYITEPEYNGPDTICVVICSDTDPEFCDTTTVAIDVSQYVCEDVFPADTMLLKGENGEAAICVLLPPASTYSLLIDQLPYTQPLFPCDFDTLIFYTYAFTVGQGHDGPYEVTSWKVNGNTFSGTVQDMDELAAMMNVWDPNGGWTNMGLFSAISGGNSSTVYGQMKLKHLGTNVPTTIQANYTVVASSSEIPLSGVGWHEVIFVDEITGCTDTMNVNIVEPTPETITEILPPNVTEVEVCVDSDELPGNIDNISLCGLPQNGFAATTSLNCVTYFPNDDFVGEDEFCVIVCDDSPSEGPFCDTTFVRVVIEAPNDEVDVIIDAVETTEVCVGNLLQFPGNMVSAGICGEDANQVDASISNGDCVTLDPADDFVGDAAVCVVHCMEAPITGVITCDTTFVNIFVKPKKDTVEVEIIDFNPIDVCLNNVIGLPGTTTNATICGENIDQVDAEISSLECLQISHTPGFFNGVSEICVVHCDDSNPTVCDTTIVIVTVDIDCPDVFDEDIIYVTKPEVCVPVALTEIGAYEIIVDGVPYSFPPKPCDEDVIAFYSYSFTFGAGTAGPYEVISWEVGGDTYSGTVSDMNELVNQMNQWDPNAQWLNDNGSSAVSNEFATVDAVNIYGNMVIRHIATGINTTLFPNFTNIAQGSSFDLPGLGLHELVIIDTSTLCADTVEVYVAEVETETIIIETPFETPISDICVDVLYMADNWGGSLCEAPQNGNLQQTGTNCFDYQSFSGFAGLDEFCMVVCSDKITQTGGPICDTTFVKIIVHPTTDQVDPTLQSGTPTTVCLDNELEIDAPIVSSGICDENADEVDATVDNTACVSLDPAADFVGVSEVCVYHCYELVGVVVCDTTYLSVLVLPKKDTVTVDLIGFDPVDICLVNESALQLAGNIASSTVCQENPNEVDATTGADDCVTVDPAEPFVGTSEICVIHCDDTNPSICDTTIIIVNVAYPCEELWVEDTIVHNSPKYCSPIAMADFGIFDILLNGADYQLPPEPCNEDSLVYYTYSFTVGAGAAGPYSVSWILDGDTYTTNVQDMNELAAWMNTVDDGGTWTNETNTTSISNPHSFHGYGTMTVTQISSGVPAILQSNFTTVAFGTCIFFDEPGLQELIITDTQTGCSDTLYIWYVENEDQSISYTTPNGTSTDDICIDVNGLPGNVSTVELCNTPQEGNVSINGTCINYEPIGFFSGTEEICVVICDDSAAPFGPFCQTTYIQITVEEPDCVDLFDQDTYQINTTDGNSTGEFCVPIKPEDFNIYEVILNGVDYTLPIDGCDIDSLVFYTYSFTVGAGNAGPYEVTNWEVDGNNNSTTVQDMNELTTWMNQVDPTGNWVNDSQSFSINGGGVNTNYGNLIVTHIGTQIPAVLLPNVTTISQASTLYLPEGTNELVFINTENGCVDEVTVHVGVPAPKVLVASRVFLQGPYEGGQMNDNLRAKGWLPLEEPYTDYNPISGVYKFIHTNGGGGETTTSDVLSVTGPDAIVDWVFLELRAKDDNTKIEATRSALIQRDGDIVDVDGFSPVSFDVPTEEYYLVIRHRNHLGIMSAEPLLLSQLVTAVDFTDGSTPVYGNNALKDLGNGEVVMWGGDVNADGNLTFQGGNNDPDAIFFQVILAPANTGFDQNYIYEGYFHGDANLDGEVIYQGTNNDVDFMIFFNVLSNPENPNFVINKVFTEKLP
jgi:hypothetical protein